MALTNLVQVAVADAIFYGKATIFPHTNAYVGLLTSDPTSVGLQTSEPSSGGYARVQPTWETVDSTDPFTVTGTTSFSPATSSWGTMNYVALFDASAGGNMLAYQSITPLPVATDDQPQVTTNTRILWSNDFTTASADGDYVQLDPYKVDTLTQVLLHGGTMAAGETWLGLASGTGAADEVDSTLDAGYSRRRVKWETIQNDPVKVQNTTAFSWNVHHNTTWNKNLLMLYKESAGSADAWTYVRYNLGGPTSMDSITVTPGNLVITF